MPCLPVSFYDAQLQVYGGSGLAMTLSNDHVVEMKMVCVVPWVLLLTSLHRRLLHKHCCHAFIFDLQAA